MAARCWCVSRRRRNRECHARSGNGASDSESETPYKQRLVKAARQQCVNVADHCKLGDASLDDLIGAERQLSKALAHAAVDRALASAAAKMSLTGGSTTPVSSQQGEAPASVLVRKPSKAPAGKPARVPAQTPRPSQASRAVGGPARVPSKAPPRPNASKSAALWARPSQAPPLAKAAASKPCSTPRRQPTKRQPAVNPKAKSCWGKQDWICWECKRVNWARRVQCQLCATLRPDVARAGVLPASH